MLPVLLARLGNYDTHYRQEFPYSGIASLLLANILLFVVPGCRQVSEPEGRNKNWKTEQAELIAQAGDRLGVPVLTEPMLHFAQGGASSFSAPALKLEDTPATELPRGVNLGVAYFDLPGQKFPKGFYKIRASADVKQIGRLKGTGQLINEKNEIVVELPAMVEVRSMTPPERSALRLTPISFCTGAACHIGGEVNSGVGGDYWHCSGGGGYTVCIHIGGPFETD